MLLVTDGYRRIGARKNRHNCAWSDEKEHWQ